MGIIEQLDNTACSVATECSQGAINQKIIPYSCRILQQQQQKNNVQMNIDKYRLAANITEYHILSNLIVQRISIPKLMMIRQLFHVKISS